VGTIQNYNCMWARRGCFRRRIKSVRESCVAKAVEELLDYIRKRRISRSIIE